jgi:hypothetical protein
MQICLRICHFYVLKLSIPFFITEFLNYENAALQKTLIYRTYRIEYLLYYYYVPY